MVLTSLPDSSQPSLPFIGEVQVVQSELVRGGRVKTSQISARKMWFLKKATGGLAQKTKLVYAQDILKKVANFSCS